MLLRRLLGTMTSHTPFHFLNAARPGRSLVAPLVLGFTLPLLFSDPMRAQQALLVMPCVILLRKYFHNRANPIRPAAVYRERLKNAFFLTSFAFPTKSAALAAEAPGKTVLSPMSFSR